MAGLGVRLFTDEMISPDVAVALRLRGYNAESCAEAERAGQEISDAEQLAYAAQHERAIVSFNIGDFSRIEAEWKAAGRVHHGIILSPEIRDTGTLMRRLAHHLDHVSPAQQYDTLLWLSPVQE